MEENKNTKQEVLTAEDAKALAPLYTDVIKALKQVYDPEIPVNIYDLGLIYELVINKEHDVAIKMTFTAPNCPMADEVMARESNPATLNWFSNLYGTRACSLKKPGSTSD